MLSFLRFFGCCALLCLGLPIAVPLSASAAEDLRVLSFSPEGEVTSLNQIVVRFHENMRPLGVMEQDPATSPLQLSAPDGLPPGNFRWLDPATLAWLADEIPTGPWLIEASVPEGVTALSGAKLAKGISWNVSMPPLTLSLEAPSALAPEQAFFYIRANYPLKQDALQQGLSLSLNGKKQHFTVEPQQEPAWRYERQHSWTWRVTLKNSLPPDAELSIRMAGGLHTREGNVPLPAQSWTIPTYSELALSGWYMGRANHENPHEKAQPESSLVLQFNNPVTSKDLLAHLKITPQPELSPDSTLEAHDATQTSISLPMRWKPDTDYTVTLGPGLKDSYGTSLNQAVSFQFHTGDFYPLLHMEQGIAYLERDLGGALPLFVRNIDTVNAHVRFVPWSIGEASYPAFIAPQNGTLPDSPLIIQQDLSFDFSARKNENLHYLLKLPLLLEKSGLTSLTGFVDLSTRYSLDGPQEQPVYEAGLDARLQVTNLGLHVKSGMENGLAWITGLDSGKPLEKVDLTLLDQEGRALWSGSSGPDGLAKLPGQKSLPSAPAFLKAALDGDVSVLPLEHTALPLSSHSFPSAKDQDRPWNVHSLTQLPLYQPGQDVRFQLFFQVFSDSENKKRWLPLTGEALTIEIRDSRDKIVHSQEAVTNDFGSVSGELSLPESSPLGYYRIQASSENLTSPCYGQAFQVASFRAPDFKVDIAAPVSRPNLLPTDPARQVTLTAGYFSGAPLPGAEATMDLRSQDYSFAPERLQGFKTGWAPSPLFWRIEPQLFTEKELVTTLPATLDQEGQAQFTLPELRAESGKPVLVSLEATVSDASGLATQGNASFLIHPSAWYVGIRAPRFIPAGQDATLEFRAAAWDNQALSGMEIVVRALRVTSQNGDTSDEEPVWEQRVALDDPHGASLSTRFEKSGQYHIIASITDPEGRENSSRLTLFVPGGPMEWLRLPSDGSLELMSDEEEYRPGSTARLMFQNPFPPDAATRGLLTVERNGVRSSRLVEINGESPSVEIPLTHEDAPYVFVTLTLIKGRDAAPPVPDLPELSGQPGGTEDKGRPRVIYGVTMLKVTENLPLLEATVNTDKDEYRPGGAVRAIVRVTRDARPLADTQVTLLAVDERVLRAAGNSDTYHPALSFPMLYTHGVKSADTRTRLLNLNLPLLNEMASPMYRTMAAESAFPAPAQGMDMAQTTGANVNLRQNFSPMAFWLAEGRTDAGGNLEASFTLPDTLTSYRVVAVVADQEGGFATGERALKVNQPLQLLSALPRFASAGDRLDGRILVQNNSAATARVRVQASAEGMRLDASERETEVPAGQSRVLSFPLVLEDPGLAFFQVSATMSSPRGEEHDALRITLPIVPALPLTTVAAAGMLRQGEQYSLPVSLPQALDTRSRLTVSLAPSPVVGLSRTAETVLDYPWLCLEQRLSKAWVRLMRIRYGKEMGLPESTDSMEDRDAIREIMESVPSFQRYDGSLALWPGLSQGDFYLTAYALLVHEQLSVANSGMSLGLDEDVEQQARRYLLNSLEQHTDPEVEERPYLAAEALSLYVLASSHPAEVAVYMEKVLNAAEQSAENSPMIWGALMLAADRLPEYPNQAEQQARLIRNLEKNVNITPTQLHFATSREYASWRSLGSLLRDNSMALAALAITQPNYPRLEALAWWVSQGLGEKSFLSTQEGAYSLWGLTSYLEQLGGDGEVRVSATWNGGEAMQADFSRLVDDPVTQIWPADRLLSPDTVSGNTSDSNNGSAHQNATLLLQAQSGNPYWTARFSYASPSLPAQAENAGFYLTRTWITPGPWTVGDIVDVEVTVQVPATRRHVLLFDPFPAGLEPLRATRVDLQQMETGYQPPWQWEEIREDGVLLYTNTLHPGVYTYKYQLRAAAPGSFIQRPGNIEEMYTPEVFGRSAPERVIVQGEDS